MMMASGTALQAGHKGATDRIFSSRRLANMTTALLDGLTRHHGALVETGRDSWLCLPIMSSGRDDIICGIGDWRRRSARSSPPESREPASNIASAGALKIYDKAGIVLRIETTANDVSFFKNHRKVEHRNGPATRALAPVKKSIYSLIDLRAIHCASSTSSPPTSRNPNTRAAYAVAVRGFCRWLEARGIRELGAVRTHHVSVYVEVLTRSYEAPTVKQHLAAIRMLYDRLIVGQAVRQNPAAPVHGPKHVVKKGKTPVLDGDEARRLLDSIDISIVVGLRDRALIALLIYTFARVSAALHMNVDDYYPQGKRWWVRLHEKGGSTRSLRAAPAARPLGGRATGPFKLSSCGHA
jgi:hypothetical protein